MFPRNFSKWSAREIKFPRSFTKSGNHEIFQNQVTAKLKFKTLIIVFFFFSFDIERNTFDFIIDDEHYRCKLKLSLKVLYLEFIH